MHRETLSLYIAPPQRCICNGPRYSQELFHMFWIPFMKSNPPPEAADAAGLAGAAGALAAGAAATGLTGLAIGAGDLGADGASGTYFFGGLAVFGSHTGPVCLTRVPRIFCTAMRFAFSFLASPWYLPSSATFHIASR